MRSRFIMTALVGLLLVVLAGCGPASTKDLFQAMKEQNVEKVEELVKAGVDPNQLSTEGDVYSDEEKKEKMDLLKDDYPMDSYPDSGILPLQWASQNCNVEMVEALVDSGADVNGKSPDDDGTALMATMMRIDEEPSGAIAITELLIKSGADVRARKKTGWTALHDAAAFQDARVVEMLLVAGADPNAMDDYKNTPLKNASGRFGENVDDLLRRYGAVQ